MRQVIVKKLEDPVRDGTLELSEDTEPPVKEVRRGFVRIRVLFASLNPADALQIRGEYQEKRKPPFVPCAEMSGIVEAVGDSVSPFRVGQKVCGLAPSGALSETVDVHTGGIFPVSEGIPMEEASGACVAFGTAWMALVQRAKVSSASRVLIVGGAGGVGSAAVQICLAIGADVTATATSPRKAAFIRSLGNADVILLRKDDVNGSHSKFSQHAGERKYDVILDNVGGSLTLAALRSLRWGGHLCIVGFAAKSIPRIPANLLLVKNVTLHGIYWGGHLIQSYPQPLRESVAATMALLSSRRARVPVNAVYGLEDVQKAFDALQRGLVSGKIVVRVAALPFAAL